MAYLWANRIPNIPPPSIRIGNADFIPITQKTPVPVEVPDPQWKYLGEGVLGRCRMLKIRRPRVAVLKLANQKAVEIDLSKVKLPPGDYHLAGYWDWTPFQATGAVHVRQLSISSERNCGPHHKID